MVSNVYLSDKCKHARNATTMSVKHAASVGTSDGRGVQET